MLVTTTGWTLEYIDNMSLCRAIKLIRYLNRRKTRSSAADTITDPQQQATYMSAMLSSNDQPAPIMQLPPHLREAMEWAEGKRKQMRGDA